MANIRKRGESYEITVSAGYDSTGKKLRRSTTFRPDPLTATGRQKAESVKDKEARAYAAEFEQQVKLGLVVGDYSMRFSDLAERYLQEYAFINLSRRTAEGYADYIKKVLIPKFGRCRIRDLCQQQLNIQTFFNDMTKPRADGTQLAASTIRRRKNILSGIMTWAVNMQLIPRNPVQCIKSPREAFKEDSVMNFTAEELKRFIHFLEIDTSISEQLKLFYIMAAFSGCRRGELIALNWTDIDFDSNTIRVFKTASKIRGGIIIKETKTPKGRRIVNMPASVMQQAKQWRKHQIEWRLQMGTAWQGADNVFSQVDGKRMYPDTVSAKFTQIIQKYNTACRTSEELPKITLHGLRHTAASILINQHMDVAAVSKRLGHSRTSVTLDTYTHAIKEADKAAADLLEDLAKDAGIG